MTVEAKGDAVDDQADTILGFLSDSAGENFYFAVLGAGGGKLGLYRYAEGTSTQLELVSTIISENNIWYTIKLGFKDSTVYVKRWPIDEDEPSDWQIDRSGIVPYGNHLVVGGIRGDQSEDFWFDNITVAPFQETIPTLSEWGMLVLALFVLAAGSVIVLRRTQCQAA